MYSHNFLNILLLTLVAATSSTARRLRGHEPVATYDQVNREAASIHQTRGWARYQADSSQFNRRRDDGCQKIQYQFPNGTNGNGTVAASRAAAVKQYYKDAFDQYADAAFGNDSFNPVAMTGGQGGGGWGLIIIDGLDTAIVMGHQDIVNRQLEWIAGVDFTTSTDLRIDGFDTIIRVIAGLLSGYDLITSGKVPFADTYNKNHVDALLTGARDLADLISPLFNSPTGLPYFWLNITSGEASGGINTAVAGTIILEYHRLSDLTGDNKYRDQADKAQSYLLSPDPAPQYPNLIGGNIDIDTGKLTTMDAGWNSGIDSFFEYLIKSVVYDPKQQYAKDYENFWVTAVESTIAHLAVHPYGKDDVTWITQLDNSGKPLWQMDDYSCFAGGNFLLGGAYLGRPDFIQLGLDFTDSCRGLFNSTTSGLNPLSIAWYGPDNLASNPDYNGESDTGKQARDYYNSKDQGYFINFQSGFSNLNTMYPEPIESIMYAWRITGDQKWQDDNWAIFSAIRTDAQRDGIVASSLWDVTQPYGGGAFPDIPSYFFAETLKYLYLTFSDPLLVSLDEFQFNTECHPFRVQQETCTAS